MVNLLLLLLKLNSNELLTTMKGILNKMETMKRDLSAEHEAADSRLVKMRLTKCVEFEHKGNKKQHIFNEEVHNKIESATKATPTAVEKAMESLKEGEKLITVRQKLIRIADRSEYAGTR